MDQANLWNQLLVWPITNILIGFYKLCEWAHIPGPLGFAIIFMTIAIRLLLYPLMHKQLSSAKKMNDLKPHLDALSVKHKDDKTALSQAQMALYKEHGVNPMEGCLTTIIQFPILIALYNVFYSLLGSTDIQAFAGTINKILYFPFLHLTTLDTSFFGMNIMTKPSEWQTQGWWLLAIPVITGLLQFVQSKLMMPQKQPSAVSVQPSDKKSKDLAVANKEPEKKDDMMEMQKQMMLMMPIMFGFFAYGLPVGLALYWNVFGLFGIIQQLQVNKK